jgi:hypothetical protein
MVLMFTDEVAQTLVDVRTADKQTELMYGKQIRKAETPVQQTA